MQNNLKFNFFNSMISNYNESKKDRYNNISNNKNDSNFILKKNIYNKKNNKKNKYHLNKIYNSKNISNSSLSLLNDGIIFPSYSSERKNNSINSIYNNKSLNYNSKSLNNNNNNNYNSKKNSINKINLPKIKIYNIHDNKSNDKKIISSNYLKDYHNNNFISNRIINEIKERTNLELTKKLNFNIRAFKDKQIYKLKDNYYTSNTINNIISNRKLNLNYSKILLQGKDPSNSLKKNQDNILIISNENFYVFGIFDGHGEFGHIISKHISEYLNNYFLNNNYNKKYFVDNNFQNIYKLYQLLENSLKNFSENKTILSGTAITLLIIFNDYSLISSNLGDCKGILINNNNNIIKELTIEHNFSIKEEKERIFKFGGEIKRIKNKIGPLRVYNKDSNLPGLVLSRSLGDFMAKKIGVSNIPFINYIENVKKDGIGIVIASDGIWEYTSNEKVKDIIINNKEDKNCDDACNEIKDYAIKMWKVNGNIIDDISIIVIYL